MGYESALLDLAKQRPDVCVLTAENRAAIRGLEGALGDRFIDVGIAEQTLVGAAAGMALRGRIPVVHGLAAFLTMRAFEFIRTDVALAKLPVKLVGYIPGFLSDANGPTHQAVEDVALMRGIPGMQVFCPSDEADLVRELPSILDAPHPCYVRYTSRPEIVRRAGPAEAGRAEVLAEGTDATLLTHGILLPIAVATAELLAEGGYSVGVVNVRWVEPLDEPAVLCAALRSRRLFTLEDHLVRGGLYSAVVELLSRERVVSEVQPVGLQQRWFRPGKLDDVLVHEGFTPQVIAMRVRASLRDSARPGRLA